MFLSYIFLVLSGTFSAGASILLRLAGQLKDGDSIRGGISLLGLPQPLLLRLLAVGAYGLGFLLYAASLKKLDLGIAYPMMVTITLLELFAYNAIVGGVTIRMALGATLLIFGLFLLAPTGPNSATQS